MLRVQSLPVNRYVYPWISPWLLVALVAIAGCAQDPVTGTSQFVLMSEEDEIALGRETHAQIIKRYGRYDDPKLQDYVQRVGEAVAAKSHRSDLIYRFTVLDSDEVNAFALPGGYIYITRGLLAYLNSEAELAAVLGHEVGHVTARHSVEQYTAQQAANLGVTLGAILVPELRTGNAQDLVNVLGTALLRGYGREHELEADRLGAEYLASTGYDPQAMIAVIGVLKDQERFERERAKAENREPKVYHGVFATHPDNDTRLQEVVGRADALRTPTARRVNRDEFLAMLDGLAFGPGTREGVLRGPNFYHQDMGFALRFPQGWRVENRPDRLIARPQTNDALLQVTVEERNKRLSPREFMEQRIKPKRLSKGDDLFAGELPAHTALADAETPFGGRRSRLTVVNFNNRAFIFAGAAKDKRAPRKHDTAFLNTALSLHALRGEEKALAQGLRIRIERARRDTDYAKLAQVSRIANYPEAQLRLINGQYPDGEPVPRSLIKTVK